MEQFKASLFEALSAEAELKDYKQEFEQARDNQAISFSQVISYIQHPYAAELSKVKDKINNDLIHRRLYLKLLDKICDYYSPKQIAASSQQAILSRAADNFEIQIATNDDAADSPATNLLTVRLSMRDENCYNQQTAVLHCICKDVLMPLELETVGNGNFETYVSANDAIYLALANVDCEIYVHLKRND